MPLFSQNITFGFPKRHFYLVKEPLLSAQRGTFASSFCLNDFVFPDMSHTDFYKWLIYRLLWICRKNGLYAGE